MSILSGIAESWCLGEHTFESFATSLVEEVLPIASVRYVPWQLTDQARTLGGDLELAMLADDLVSQRAIGTKDV